MSVHLYLAPAATGKTAYVLNRGLDMARGLRAIPRVVVPTALQVRSWRRRLAQAGGVMGVRVLTFERLYAECLRAAGEVYTQLSEPVRYRLIRTLLDDLPLVHYAPLTGRPGFIQMLEERIAELKAARVWPEAFADAVHALGDEPRLRELAQIYAAYQERLQANRWADRAGLGWLTVESLEERAPRVGKDWPILVVDGFDSFTPVQLALLRVLLNRVQETIITLTGTEDVDPRPLAQRRFVQTRMLLEKELGAKAAPLPDRTSHRVPVLAHLANNLFRANAPQVESGGAIELVETPDRAGEVRAALRWLKARLVQDGMHPGQVALLARAMASYRPYVLQIAAEFGLPVRLVDGLPLRTNPLISALLDLLRLVLPGSDNDLSPVLPRRLVIEAWRSPYFDWSALPEEDAAEAIGIDLRDADDLDAVARWGRVIGGLDQWQGALDDLCDRFPDLPDASSTETGLDEERGPPARVPVGSGAQALRIKFQRFVHRLTPPPGTRSYREFVGWLEALIGPDPRLHSSRSDLPKEPTALQMVARVQAAPQDVADRDLAALRALKDVLRGLAWAEEALGASALSPTHQTDFARFYDELAGAIQAATYHLPLRPECEEVVIVDAIRARGVPFRAVAVLGLAEGEFPATLTEDALLLDADRQSLRDRFDLALEPSTESAEAEFFYETVTRPRERLLLTRPRLAENGAPWQASPFWEEVRRLVKAKPRQLSSESVPVPEQVASWPELMTSLSAHPGRDALREWAQQAKPGRCASLDRATHLFRLRQRDCPSPYDGDLSTLSATLAQRFGPLHVWSASRLESYRTCPFLFFFGSVLGPEARKDPTEGLDARQLGNIYHHILEEVYQSPKVADPSDLDQVLAVLDEVTTRILDRAPQIEGFRETAWWMQTRQEITANVRRSLEALAECHGDFVPHRHEAAFGLQAQPPLIVDDGEDRFRLRGFIDRVDRTPNGRLRVIDYKTSGPSAFTKKQVAEGKKLQLPLYALAARDALDLGEPIDGFYWHVRHAEASAFTIAKFGPAQAIRVAVAHAWEAVHGAREGRFAPHPPDDGCPAFCPASGFCWRYQAGFRA